MAPNNKIYFQYIPSRFIVNRIFGVANLYWIRFLAHHNSRPPFYHSIQFQSEYRRIARKQGESFILCLCDQQQVERVGMGAMHIAHGLDMAWQDG